MANKPDANKIDANKAEAGKSDLVKPGATKSQPARRDIVYSPPKGEAWPGSQPTPTDTTTDQPAKQ